MLLLITSCTAAVVVCICLPIGTTGASWIHHPIRRSRMDCCNHGLMYVSRSRLSQRPHMPKPTTVPSPTLERPNPAALYATSSSSRSSSSSPSVSLSPSMSLEGLLQANGFGARLGLLDLESLSSANVWAEVVLNGKTRVARIKSIVMPTDYIGGGGGGGGGGSSSISSSGTATSPKLVVTYVTCATETTNPPLVARNTSAEATSRKCRVVDAVIDFGQVTTIWDANDKTGSSRALGESDDDGVFGWLREYYSFCDKTAGGSTSRNPSGISLDDDSCENALDRLYQSRIGRTIALSTRGTQTLTKKQITNLISNHYGTVNVDSGSPSHQQKTVAAADTILRQVCKTGPEFSRLVDSNDLAKHYGSMNKRPSTSGEESSLIYRRRFEAAILLASDSNTGGRFKRWPCLFVQHDPRSQTLSYVNGGWLVTDPSVRAGTEARKFVERGGDGGGQSDGGHVDMPRTLADTRILRRLECLAMGELTATTTTSRDDKNDMNRRLELDVRETLNAMNLPLSPYGAKRALVQTGHWSDDTAAKLDRLSEASTFQPWSQAILNAANWYVDYLAGNSRSLTGANIPAKIRDQEISDLRHLPCVSIDAARATFRDDAIGVRKRAATGRKVVPEASQWEILIHVADVSDIYASHGGTKTNALKSSQMALLKGAAESRGSSRYDLPLGPLHLLPPVVLRSLAFPNENATATSTGCRCVTLWAYVDERDGRLLDAGVERTLTSLPIKLSFAEATSLMEGSSSPETERARAILRVVERNLKKWHEYHRKHSEAAHKREIRLKTRENQSRDTGSMLGSRDDGVDGFRRTRGHRLVDIALDLYSNASTGLLVKAKAPMPRAIGADASRGGRFATAPLRRYIDGQGQRQLLAVLCNYGRPMSLDECREAANVANKATNAIANVRSLRSS